MTYFLVNFALWLIYRYWKPWNVNMENDQQDNFFWKSNDVTGWLFQMNWFPRFSSKVVSNKLFVGGTSIWRYIRVITLISFWSFHLVDKVIFKYYVLIFALNVTLYHTEKGNYFHFTFLSSKDILFREIQYHQLQHVSVKMLYQNQSKY